MEGKKYNILVTGVGAIIGYGIIKSIRRSEIDAKIIGMDIYSDAVGQEWCDKFIQAKYAVDPEYITFLEEIIDENKVDLVFFGTEQEIYRVGLEKEKLGRYAKKMVINKVQLLELSKDKWKTYQFLIENNMKEYAIPSVIQGDYKQLKSKFGSSFMLKPRSSYASKGIVLVNNEEEFAFYKKRMADNFMAQPIVGDMEHEYTVGVFGLGEGEYIGPIIMKRKLSQEGATSKAEVVFDDLFEKVIEKLVKVLKPLGPTNLQFRKHEGNYVLLEINPRISSSTSVRAALGYNESLMSVRYFLENRIEKPKIVCGKAVRFIDEVISVL